MGLFKLEVSVLRLWKMSVEHWVADFPRSIASSPCLWKPIVRRRPPPAQPVCPPRGFVPFVVLIPLVWARCHPGFRGGPSGDFSGAFRMAHSCSRKNSSAPRKAAWTAGLTPRHTRWDVSSRSPRQGGASRSASRSMSRAAPERRRRRARPRSAALSRAFLFLRRLCSPPVMVTVVGRDLRHRLPEASPDPAVGDGPLSTPARRATNKTLFSKYQLNGYI